MLQAGAVLIESAADRREADPSSAQAEAAEDAALIAAIVRGEREALGRLYDRHAPLLLALAVRILGDRALAEDVLHDVVLEAWHRARDFDPARGNVRAWLVTRMRSRALDRRTATNRQTRLAEQVGRDPDRPTSTAMVTLPDGDRVRRHLAGLPGDLVQVIELAYFDGLSFSDIARHLSIPIGTVKSRMARALHLLRERLATPSGVQS
jgi:RNA polymerase sigma-70 factor (ECF subfamily)